MSHFTTIKTQLIHADYLKKSLADLGLRFEEGAVKIRGYGGRTTAAEIRIVPNDNSGYDIGFRQGKLGYEVIADWWGIKGVDQKAFVQQLSQRYAYHAAKDKLQKQGFDLAAEETRADGQIHLVLRRMT